MAAHYGKTILDKGIRAPFIESALKITDLKGLVGAGITLGTNLAVTANATDIDNHLVAVNDGTFVTISGALGKLDDHATTINTWTTLFTLSTVSGSSGVNLEARSLKPHSAIVGLDADQDEIDAGTVGTGLVRGRSWICGPISMQIAAVALGGGTSAAVPGLVRVICTAANTYEFQYILNAATSDPNTAVNYSCAFTLRYPVEPIDAIAQA
jgi:hypothetical protein